MFKIDNNGLLDININGITNGENLEMSKKDFNYNIYIIIFYLYFVFYKFFLIFLSFYILVLI